MYATSNLASIDNEAVDRVVMGAMALLTDRDACRSDSALPLRDDDVRMAVYCDEQQQSAVILRCNYPLAVQLTGTMLELEADDIYEADMLDATGELVNVIAGNLRGLIASTGIMSAPFALDQSEYALFRDAATNTYSLEDYGLQIVRV